MRAKIVLITGVVVFCTALLAVDRLGAQVRYPISGDVLPLGAGAMTVSPGTIATQGRGVVRVVPDRVRFRIQLFFKPGSSGFDDAGKTVAAALVANGVADAKWEIPLTGFAGSNTLPVVTGTIAHPTRSLLEEKIRATLRAIPESLAASVQNYQVFSNFEADDCASAEAQAVTAALAQAHTRAESVASAAHLHLGQVVAVNAVSISGAGCPTKPNNDGSGNFGGSPDGLGEPAVLVSATTIVTYGVH